MSYFDKFSAKFDSQATQERVSYLYENGSLLSAEAGVHRKPYTITIPPPNITGVLHLGHVMNNTLQDVLVVGSRRL